MEQSQSNRVYVSQWGTCSLIPCGESIEQRIVPCMLLSVLIMSFKLFLKFQNDRGQRRLPVDLERSAGPMEDESGGTTNEKRLAASAKSDELKISLNGFAGLRKDL